MPDHTRLLAPPLARPPLTVLTKGAGDSKNLAKVFLSCGKQSLVRPVILGRALIKKFKTKWK